MLLRLVLLIPAVLLLVSCTTSATAQTFEEARQSVLDQVVQPDTLDHPVIVFGLPEPLHSGDRIGPYNKEGYGPSVEPTTIEAETWFFWIDDAPGARFAHPGRFVLITQATGELTVAEHSWWPVLNGQGLWTESDEYWNEDNWAFSNRSSGPQSEVPPAGAKARAALPAAGAAQAAGSGAAIVINGWEPGEAGQEDFEVDANGMHDILNDAGFDVTYFGPKEDVNPDRDGEPTVENRLDWFRDKAEELQPGDTLVVYVTGHGGVTSAGSGAVGPVFEDLLLAELKRFDPGVNIIVVLDSCYVGSFADSMSQVADVTVMSTSATDPSYGDVDPLPLEGWHLEDDPNPDDEGAEYTSGFVEDWKEIMADPQQKAAVDARALQQGTNFWQELTALSHVSATEKDVTALSGWTFPSLVRGAPETRPTPVPTTTVLQDAQNDGVSCVTGQPLTTETPPAVDITRAVADILLGESSGQPEQVRFTIELDRAEAIDTPIFGGVEFADGSTDISPLNPDWYYDGIGNKNFSFGIRGPRIVPELHLYEPGSGWTSNANTFFTIEVGGNRIYILVPVAEIPPNSPFYVSLTDYSACDAVGLDDDRQPTGVLPPLLGR